MQLTQTLITSENYLIASPCPGLASLISSCPFLYSFSLRRGGWIPAAAKDKPGPGLFYVGRHAHTPIFFLKFLVSLLSTRGCQRVGKRSTMKELPDKLGRVGKAKGGRPKTVDVAKIDIDTLPSRFSTAEELRGYILLQTNNGRDIVDQLLRDYKSHKTSKTIRKEVARMLLEMLQPAKNQSLEVGMQSADGQFVFRWQNEVLPDA
jgi:hypothetical protein